MRRAISATSDMQMSPEINASSFNLLKPVFTVYVLEVLFLFSIEFVCDSDVHTEGEASLLLLFYGN